MITEEQKHKIIKRLEPYRPGKIGIFGSYARDEETQESDLDVLVDLHKKINLFDLVELENDLSEMLNVKVDLVTENSLNKHLKPYIQQSLIYILNEKER